jgi:DNA anti-recombination protein RmuC
MDMLLMDLQKLQKRIHCLHNEMNSLDESYQKLNKQLDQSKKEYQLVHEVLEYCLLNDVDPTYARIMLSQLEDNTEATSNTPTKRATRITNLSRFGPVQEASITES